MRLSIVVPVFNGMPEIKQTCAGLLAAVASHPVVEVIFVDNGSVDDSADWLRAEAVSRCDRIRLVEAPDAPTIGAVRNRGALESSGEFLYFLDADCLLAEGVLSRALSLIEERPDQILGAPVLPPPNGTWVEKTWLGVHRPRDSGPTAYVNSGNLIVPSHVFREIGGFDNDLTTGEDAEICARARASGYPVWCDPSLEVFHLRNAKSLGAFFRKEVWHAVGMWERARGGFRSPVIWATAAHFVMFCAAMLLVAFHPVSWLFSALATLALLFLIPSASVAYRYPHSGPRTWVGATILYAVYLTARVASIVPYATGAYRPHRESDVCPDR